SRAVGRPLACRPPPEDRGRAPNSPRSRPTTVAATGGGHEVAHDAERRNSELDGRVALVTGGGSGIGAAAARRRARAGARGGVLGRTEEELRQVAEEIEAEGGQALALTADISEQEEMRRAVEELVERFGRLDVVFANAGINGVWAPLDELELSEWRRTIDINLTGTFIT